MRRYVVTLSRELLQEGEIEVAALSEEHAFDTVTQLLDDPRTDDEIAWVTREPSDLGWATIEDVQLVESAS